MTLQEAIDFAEQYRTPSGRPNVSPAVLSELKREIAKTLRAEGMSVPWWIDARSNDDVVEPLEKGSAGIGLDSIAASTREDLDPQLHFKVKL